MNEFIKLFVFINSLIEIGFGIHVNRQKNVSLCEVSSCLRKCCPRGQFLWNKTCQETETNFNFSDVGVSLDAVIHDEVVECNEEQTRFMLDETDEFYVEDNNLVWPLLNLTMNYAFYCIDMIDDFTAAKALICYGAIAEENRVFFCSGNVILIHIL